MLDQEEIGELAIVNIEALAKKEPYGEQLKQVLDIFASLAMQLPQLRDDPVMLEETVKAVGRDGVSDVATAADVYMQEKLKEEVASKHPDWQFWGEEGSDNTAEYDSTKTFLFITDPIEGTNNFKARKDDSWDSVVALVDIATKEPVVGIVAHPTGQRLYIGLKGAGVYIAVYDKAGQIIALSPMTQEPERPEFTYNNSPHFEAPLLEQVERFFTLGTVQPNDVSADNLTRSRKTVEIANGDITNMFVDPESGALEAVRNRGTIYFKTSNEMAAVFVVLQELGGKVTDADGNPWSLGINSLVAARNEADYTYLKALYDRTR